MKYGTIVAIFRVGTLVTLLLVPFEVLGQMRMDCPLFVRGQHLVAVAAASLICDVSFQHHCGSRCRVVHQGCTRQVERQFVDITPGATFIHDSANEFFYYNVLCLNN